MKKYIATAVVAVVVLAGCSADDVNTGINEQEDEGEGIQAEENEGTDEGEQESSDDAEEEAVENEEGEEGEEDIVEAEEPAEPVYEINPVTSNVEVIEGMEEESAEEFMLLTIDDTPDARGVDMAETLKELDTPAIFFVNAHFINDEEGEEQLKDIHEMGFEIGNHTMNHPNLQQIDEEQQREEIVGLSDRVEEIIGERPRFFRAPHGANTDYSDSVVEEEGMTRMNWSYGYDWDPDYRTAEAIADIMVNTELRQSGANLLMHDREWTADALEDIVTGLNDQGFEFVDPALLK
ncbi:polysaccharide deacetylase family protein [Shouchella shacheensis]|uniref:polysaccharide deacetylase family protein n=1 Tax=Shouchella shacheensis TaxID=1649580 RepID=UPI0007402302|nr:polysaccharide deacetylase family protein [Shouchella shacheensis]